jgi:hypothetical protein
LFSKRIELAFNPIWLMNKRGYTILSRKGKIDEKKRIKAAGYIKID